MPPPGQMQRAESKFIVFEHFEKMNTQSVRQALSEKELAWLENLQPIAPNNLTTVPGPSIALTSLAETIVYQYFANVGGVDYIMSFTSQGSIWATNVATGVSGRVAGPGVFTQPDMTTWFSQYLLINDPTAGYCVWNGSQFVRQGGVSPVITLTNPGSNYTSAPTVTISGGSGSGATAVATIGTPGVNAVNLITQGTQYALTTTVVFAGGGGTGAAATANIDPRGVTTIKVTNGGSYSNIFNPPTVTFTGGGGSGAVGVAFLISVGTTNIVYAVGIENPGSGYTSPPTIAFIGGSGGGAAATCTIGDGRILSITVTTPGTGYTSPPTVSFANVGGGTGATAAAVIGGSSVTSVTLTNPGAGYLASDVLTVTFSGGQTVLTINSGTYNTGTGAVSLTLSASASIGVGVPVTVLGLTGTGGFASLDGVWTTTAGTSGTTVNFTGPTGLGSTTITGGSLINGTIAAATAHVFPFTIGGNTLAVFQGRVWLGNGRNIQYSGTGGVDDFNAADASAIFAIQDADLTHAVTALRNFNNYLYIFGDQSVKQIGNISLNSLGNVTLFQLLTLSSDQGTIYPRSCVSFNRLTMFANPVGIYAIFGSSVQKISDDLDGIFKLIDFSQQPQAAVADFSNIHNVAWLVRYVDPLASERSILLTFNGKKWFVVNQGNSLVSLVTTSTLASGRTQTYASSGQDITQILANATIPVPIILRTALTHHGNAVQRKKLIAAGNAVTAGGAGLISVTFDTENGSVPLSYTLKSGFQLPGGASGSEGSGRYLGLTVTGTLAGFTFTNAAQEYQETSLWT